MIISLTGFMGCGKSSIGRRLSELLCCPYIDLDSVIEEMVGRSIPEIFAKDGEAVFRQMEHAALTSVITTVSSSSPYSPSSNDGNPIRTTSVPLTESTGIMVLSLGGGTVMTRECAEMVMENTICIYLRASVDTLVTNLKDEADGRPMLQSSVSLRERIEELMSQRADTYEKTSHIVVDTDGKSIDEIATAIITHPLFQQMR
ncbi:MAG: shikimate kinase [Bacteroidales bacterium]|nr:shikimate kinase [Bacteroidales bacterium]